MKIIRPRLVFALTLLFAIPGYADDIRRVYREAEELSSRDKLQRVREEVAAMKEILQEALSALRAAHERKDITQVNCVKDKLSTIRGLLRISDEASISLDEAIMDSQNQSALVNHEYVKVVMAAERIGFAQLQLQGCSGDMNDPLGSRRAQIQAPEISDEGVASFEAPSEAEASLPFSVISDERPEALSASR